MRNYRSPFYSPNRNIGQRIKYFFQNPSPLNRLISINVGVFIGILLIKVGINVFSFLYAKEMGAQLMEYIAQALSIPADLSKLMLKPWTLITSIFTHMKFFHIFVNRFV